LNNKKDDSYYASKIKDDCDFIIRETEGISFEEFSKDELLQSALMFKVIQISENGKKLSDEYRKRCDKIYWPEVFGLRNRIVHEYGNTDLQVVYESMVFDIPKLRQNLE